MESQSSYLFVDVSVGSYEMPYNCVYIYGDEYKSM